MAVKSDCAWTWEGVKPVIGEGSIVIRGIIWLVARQRGRANRCVAPTALVQQPYIFTQSSRTGLAKCRAYGARRAIIRVGMQRGYYKTSRSGRKLKWLRFAWLGALLFAVTGEASRAQTADVPVLNTLSIPSYPLLARLAGAEGTVHLSLTLDRQCNVTHSAVKEAPPMLEDAVTAAWYEAGSGIRFLPCKSKEERKMELLYIFSLEGAPTNEWTPTYTSVSGDESSVTIRITTRPADLDALGLERKNARKTESEKKNPTGSNFPIGFSALYYPPIARTANIQGDVKIEAELNSKCEVADLDVLTGPSLLYDVARKAVRNLQFPACKAEGDRVDLTFHFVLTRTGKPSLDDQWAPTYVKMIGPHEFEIKTKAREMIFIN